MATPFTTDAELTAMIERVEGVAPGLLPTKYAGIIAATNVDAYNVILEILVGRGYTKAQIDTWARRKEFNRKQGAFFTIEEANGLDKIDAGAEATWRGWDMREELLTVMLLDESGVPIDFDVIEVSYGTMNTDNDLNVSDPYDRRRGQITKW